MPCSCTRLEAAILTAFKQAVADNRLDIAEHLLKALEALEPNCMPGSSLADAYLSITYRKPSRH